MATKSTEWNSGPPPHAGWWNASVTINTGKRKVGEMWGWWNGSKWSVFTYRSNDAMGAARCAEETGARDGAFGHVTWTRYWPKNARVPRINPLTGEVTGGKK